MITNFTFTVMGRPVPKARARVVRGHAYTEPRSAAYEALVRASAIKTAREFGLQAPIFDKTYTKLILDVSVYRAANQGDLDNFVKAVSDAINGVVWADDRQVTMIDAGMSVERDNPRVVVSVRPVREL